MRLNEKRLRSLIRQVISDRYLTESAQDVMRLYDKYGDELMMFGNRGGRKYKEAIDRMIKKAGSQEALVKDVRTIYGDAPTIGKVAKPFYATGKQWMRVQLIKKYGFKEGNKRYNNMKPLDDAYLGNILDYLVEVGVPYEDAVKGREIVAKVFENLAGSKAGTLARNIDIYKPPELPKPQDQKLPTKYTPDEIDSVVQFFKDLPANDFQAFADEYYGFLPGEGESIMVSSLPDDEIIDMAEVYYDMYGIYPLISIDDEQQEKAQPAVVDIEDMGPPLPDNYGETPSPDRQKRRRRRRRRR